MEQSRLLIAIVLCLVVFLAWQFFFAPPPSEQQPAKKAEAPVVEKQQPVQEKKDQAKPYSPASDQTGVSTPSEAPVAEPSTARVITVQTPLYEAQISENGAAIFSFLLKNYRERVAADSP